MIILGSHPALENTSLCPMHIVLWNLTRFQNQNKLYAVMFIIVVEKISIKYVFGLI